MLITVIGTVLFNVALAPDYAEFVATILQRYNPIFEPIKCFSLLTLIAIKLSGNVI